MLLVKKKSMIGDKTCHEKRKRMLRVNHAGEYGARRIYQGQLAMLKNSSKREQIEHMLAQEEAHFKTFDALLPQEKTRPTALLPLWHIAGFALGAATALMGEKAAMACTIAVEETIDEHYRKQHATLNDSEDAQLKTTIDTFRQEEVEHMHIAQEHHGEEAFAYPLISALIKNGSRAAIWLSERI
jgi:3-demethoxyubiquinol 3-hydroxylase